MPPEGRAEKMAERWDAPVFDKTLILKYDRPGPRYTSYPTAPYFHEGFDTKAYERVIEETNAVADPPPLSLYFHLPFCKSVCYFCGCNVTFTKDRTLGDAYVDCVLKEMDALRAKVKPGRKVVQVHWGGGTPTFIPARVLERLWQGIASRFEIAPKAEIGVEIDPREVTDEHLDLFARSGFNRISMGIQDFDPKVQNAVHRIQPEDLTMKVVDRCRELKFESINVDLIYGLPFQTTERFADTVGKIVAMGPDRIAVFNFAYLPEMIGHQRAIPKDALPSPAEKLSILEMVVSRFTSGGYVYIGMDHFARPQDELCVALKDRTLYRNFQGYTTKAGCDLYGVGVTSIGQVGPCYAQNAKDLKGYQEKVRESGLAVFRGVLLTQDDILRRDVITRLMCHFVLYKQEIEEEYGIRFDETFAEALEDLKPMEDDGLISLHADRIEVHPLGRLLVRNVAMPFDAYLRKAGDAKRFSRTV
jgi:oxygen-independent coproporphyrinogen-3 oxidase